MNAVCSECGNAVCPECGNSPDHPPMIYRPFCNRVCYEGINHVRS